VQNGWLARAVKVLTDAGEDTPEHGWVDVMANRNAVAAFCRAHCGGILTAAGRWQEAEVQLIDAARHFDRGMPQRRAAAIIRLADLRVRQGRLEEAGQLLKGLEQHQMSVKASGERRTLTSRWCTLPDVLITTVTIGSFTGRVSTTWGLGCSGDAGGVCARWWLMIFSCNPEIRFSMWAAALAA
jgi:hypothetical protein